MKKIIAFLSCIQIFATLVSAQIKNEEKPEGKETPQYKRWYLGLELTRISNHGDFSATTDFTPAPSGDNVAQNGGIYVGYQYGKHKFELGAHEFLHNCYAFYNVPVQGGYFALTGAGIGRSLLYVPFRYTYEVAKIGQQFTLDLGGSAGLGFFTSKDGDEFSGPFAERIEGTLPNGFGFSFQRNYTERIIRPTTFTFEGTARLNWRLGNHWQTHFATRYLWNPQAIRQLDMRYYLPDGSIKQGIATTSMSSLNLSLGVQYAFGKDKTHTTTTTQTNEEDRKQHPFYIEPTFGLLYNQGSFKSRVSGGLLSSAAHYPVLSKRWGINIGYQFDRHSIETGYQQISNSVSFNYDKLLDLMTNTRTDGNAQAAHYIPIRYYNRLHTTRSGGQIHAGAGVAFAKFIDPLPTEFTLKQTGEQLIVIDGKPTKAIYTDYERMLQRQTLCFEFNGKYQKELSKHWTANVVGRYIWNPSSVREVKFDVKYNNLPPRDGNVKTSFTSFVLGAGLAYHF